MWIISIFFCSDCCWLCSHVWLASRSLSTEKGQRIYRKWQRIQGVVSGWRRKGGWPAPATENPQAKPKDEIGLFLGFSLVRMGCFPSLHAGTDPLGIGCCLPCWGYKARWSLIMLIPLPSRPVKCSVIRCWNPSTYKHWQTPSFLFCLETLNELEEVRRIDLDP